jgi:hypothetical protein
MGSVMKDKDGVGGVAVRTTARPGKAVLRAAG